jgi:hypothetical protein
MQSGPELKGRFYKFLVPRRRSGWTTAIPDVTQIWSETKAGPKITSTKKSPT